MFDYMAPAGNAVVLASHDDASGPRWSAVRRCACTATRRAFWICTRRRGKSVARARPRALLERCIWHRRRACGSHQQRAGGRGGVRGAMRSQQLVRRMAKRSAPTTDTVIPRAGGRGGIRGEAE